MLVKLVSGGQTGVDRAALDGDSTLKNWRKSRREVPQITRLGID
jgi:hypothetical protein